MPATWTRKRAIASVEVCDVFQGDPVVTDRGYGSYTILKKAYRTGIYSMDSSFATPHLEWLEAINGLANRPYWIAKDTTLSNWQPTIANTGEWYAESSAWGAFRVKRLVQRKGATGIVGQLESTFMFPRDPHFSISFILADTAEGWDTDGEPPH